MTRINLIEPAYLCDQHLLAENKEILQLCGSLRKTLNSKNGLQIHKIPIKFTLGKGHVYFFYDKGKYLFERFQQIQNELNHRGFKVNNFFPLDSWPHNCFNNWIPSSEDFLLIKQRIYSKIIQKPNWYRYYSQPINLNKISKWYL